MNNYTNVPTFDPQMYAEIVESARKSMNYSMKLYTFRSEFLDDEPNSIITLDSVPEYLR